MTTTNTSTRRAATARKLNRWQNLLTAEQARRLPPLYSTDGQGDAAVAHVKYFLGAFTWYATEFDPATGQFFGLVDNVNMRDQLPEGELGYFSADELQSASVRVDFVGASHAGCLGSFRQPVERDIHWQPQTLAAIRAELRASAVNRLNSAYRAAIAAEPTAEPADADAETAYCEMADAEPADAETPTAADRFAAGYNRINWGK